MKGYKAFDKGLKCRNFQYEEGKEYKTDEVKICNKGFHFCENPLDVLDYYDLCESEFAQIEAIGKVESEGNKSVTDNIKINAKLELPTFIKASFDFLWEKCNKKDKDKKNSSKLASSGDSSKLASSGYYSKLASSGYSSQLASSGKDSIVAGIGIDNKAKGIKGNWLVLAEWIYNSKLSRYIPKNVKSVKIDGKKIKENTYYELKNGRFIQWKN